MGLARPGFGSGPGDGGKESGMSEQVVGRLIGARAETCPDAPAVLAPDCEALTYGGLDAVVRRTGRALRRAGLQRDARVALVCSNGPQAATAFLGICAHAVCAPLNPSYRAKEFSFYLEDLQPRVLVVESGLATEARGAGAALGIPVLELTRRGSGLAGDVDLTGGDECEAGDLSSSGPDDVAVLLHTSGTTSRPKLVPLTQANLCASAHHIGDCLGLEPRDRCLNVMPLFHIHGLVAGVLATLARGGSVVCCPGFVAPRFFEWVEEFRPTWYTAVPTIHQSVLSRAQAKPELAAGHSFRFIRSCSSALAPSLMEEMEAMFRAPVIEAYGMTEAAHQMASNALPPGRRKPGSVGVAAGPEVAVMDDAGNLLPPGAAGEVVIRGPNVTAGYEKNAEANERSFTNGWFRTGDEGYLDEDGYLFLIGRRKEIINRGGEKIAPREVDEVLLRHPAVGQAAAFAAPHALLGETVAAAVVVKPGRGVGERELREFAAGSLASFKVPEKILFVPEIPKGPSGKIQRIGLAEKLGVETIRPAPGAAEFAAPRSEAEQKIANLFATTLGVERVGMRDNFFDLGGDSLLAGMVLAQLRAAAGRDVSMVAFLEDPTALGLLQSLEAPAKGTRGEGDSLRMVVRAGTEAPALFCIPGSSGDEVGFFHLARHLGTGQPVTAFRFPVGAENGYRIEELAARYVGEILEVQPDGPYHLAGVCAGGFVAYEMAQQIAARGKTVGLVALLDCYNHAWLREVGPLRRLGYLVDLYWRRFVYQQRTIRKAGLAGAPRYLWTKGGAMVKLTRQRWGERMRRAQVAAGIRRPVEEQHTAGAIRSAAARYVPGAWPGKLVLFRVAEPRLDAYDYPEMGWQGLAGEGLVIHGIPGSHVTMLGEPQVEGVAQILAGYLNLASAR